MKAAILTIDGFELRDVPIPAIGDDELLIKTHSCGVCSGDLFVYQNRADFVDSYNRLGHEASGEVVAVGKNVQHIVEGDIVTALALPAYQAYFAASANRVIKLPDTIDPTFALGEAVACCVHAANRFGTRKGDRVVIIGCGFMGLVCQQLTAYQGAGYIAAIDVIDERLAMARQLGANVTYRATDDLTHEAPFDVVIEAAGVQSAVDLGTQLVAEHGRLVLVGYHQSNNGMRSVNMQQWNYKAIDVINGHVRREDEKMEAMRQGMELMAAGHIRTEPFSTVYPFADIEQAFRDLDRRKAGLFKAVMRLL